ncbi:MAG: HD domain-containing protein [Cyanobacteriota bacterium]|nr:HD domain-containing protein [Cyanobacteriota bacterium]
MTNNFKLAQRFESALVYANQLHAGQVRKGSNIPYISHLLGVAALVLEDGGSEDEAIAALLHDAVEDCGGIETLNQIRDRFGESVARIVAGCTESETIPKPPWRERKERYLQQLRSCTPEVYRVAIADKLYNARSILMDYRRQGASVWQKFQGGSDGTLWLMNAVLDIQPPSADLLAEELARVVRELEGTLV